MSVEDKIAQFIKEQAERDAQYRAEQAERDEQYRAERDERIARHAAEQADRDAQYRAEQAERDERMARHAAEQAERDAQYRAEQAERDERMARHAAELAELAGRDEQRAAEARERESAWNQRMGRYQAEHLAILKGMWRDMGDFRTSVNACFDQTNDRLDQTIDELRRFRITTAANFDKLDGRQRTVIEALRTGTLRLDDLEARVSRIEAQVGLSDEG